MDLGTPGGGEADFPLDSGRFRWGQPRAPKDSLGVSRLAPGYTEHLGQRGGAGSPRRKPSVNVGSAGSLELAPHRKDSQDMTQQRILLGFGGLVAGALSAWLLGAFDLYFPRVQWVLLAAHNTLTRPELQATQGSFRFVLCWLDDDPTGTHGDSIEASFRDVGGVKLFRSAVQVSADGARDDWEEPMSTRARQILEDWDADLAIVGSANVPTDDAPRDVKFSLWFVPREGKGTLHYGNQRRYKLDDGILGVKDFHFDLREQLELFAWTAVAPAVNDHDQGRVLDSRLTPVVARIQSFLERDSLLTQPQRADFQLTLGRALLVLGHRAGDVQRLADATTAFREALSGYSTSDTTRHDLSAEQGSETCDRPCRTRHLAATLGVMGRWKGEMAPLEEAIALFDQQAQLYTRDTAPLDWANTQHNLGATRLALGDIGCSVDLVARGLHALTEAADIYRLKGRLPDLAMAQHNRGVALLLSGVYGRDPVPLTEALESLAQAAETYRVEQMPLSWANAETDRSIVLTVRGSFERDTTYINEAVTTLDRVLADASVHEAPEVLGRATLMRGAALLTLGELTADESSVREAVEAFNVVLDADIRAKKPWTWARAQSNRGDALAALGDVSSLTKAVAAYRLSLEETSRDDEPALWAQRQFGLGRAQALLSGVLGGTQYLQEVAMALETALGQFTRLDCPGEAVELAVDIGSVASENGLNGLAVDAYGLAGESAAGMARWPDWLKIQMALVRVATEAREEAVLERIAASYLEALGAPGRLGQLGRSQAWVNLGWVWRTLGAWREQERELYKRREISALRNGLEELPNDERATMAHVGHNLGIAHMERYYITDDREALANAIGALQESAAKQDALALEASAGDGGGDIWKTAWDAYGPLAGTIQNGVALEGRVGDGGNVWEPAGGTYLQLGIALHEAGKREPGN